MKRDLQLTSDGEQLAGWPDSGDEHIVLVGGDSANEPRDDWLPPRTLTAAGTAIHRYIDNIHRTQQYIHCHSSIR